MNRDLTLFLRGRLRGRHEELKESYPRDIHLGVDETFVSCEMNFETGDAEPRVPMEGLSPFWEMNATARNGVRAMAVWRMPDGEVRRYVPNPGEDGAKRIRMRPRTVLVVVSPSAIGGYNVEIFVPRVVVCPHGTPRLLGLKPVSYFNIMEQSELEAELRQKLQRFQWVAPHIEYLLQK